MTEFGKVINAYGLYIDFDKTTRDNATKVLSSNAEHKTEVAVRLYGELKEFSFQEFFDKLGFKLQL